MRINIKHLISSEWWRELKKEMESRIAEVEIEILEKAQMPSSNEASLITLSADRKALKELLNLPASLIEEWDVIDDI